MMIRKEHESHILDAHHDCHGPKDKRQGAIYIRFRQSDGMIAVKAFLEGIKAACPNVAKHHTQRTDRQSHGLEGKVIRFRGAVGRTDIGLGLGVQSHHKESKSKICKKREAVKWRREAEPVGSQAFFSSFVK